MDQAEWKLLKEIAELEKTPQGAYNIRRNGALDSRNSTANIEITTKTEPGKSGIDIRIKPGTRHESVHIPVIISQTGLSEMVYNDFFIGEDCDVDIVAGCGIHNTGCETSQHDGVHTFYVGKNSKVRYVERHYGGALVTLADTVCGTAAFTTGHMCVTLDCSMQYLAPASGARITCTATPRKLGKTVLVYEAVLTDDTGRTVATGVYTFFAKGPAN